MTQLLPCSIPNCYDLATQWLTFTPSAEQLPFCSDHADRLGDQFPEQPQLRHRIDTGMPR